MRTLFIPALLLALCMTLTACGSDAARGIDNQDSNTANPPSDSTTDDDSGDGGSDDEAPGDEAPGDDDSGDDDSGDDSSDEPIEGPISGVDTDDAVALFRHFTQYTNPQE